jgi:hypothetical protein
MSLLISRRVFLVVAGGNAAAQPHFEDTIRRERTLDEVRRFLPAREVENLEKTITGRTLSCGVRYPVPMGENRSDENRSEKMRPGDVVLICNHGRIRFAW